jgi:hypothetical protein
MPQGSPYGPPTWRPSAHSQQFSGALDAAEVDNLPGSAFAFPGSRKEPLVSASHVRTALARFDQVQGVTDADRALAFANIRQAAPYFRRGRDGNSWRDLMGSR